MIKRILNGLTKCYGVFRCILNRKTICYFVLKRILNGLTKCYGVFQIDTSTITVCIIKSPSGHIKRKYDVFRLLFLNLLRQPYILSIMRMSHWVETSTKQC